MSLSRNAPLSGSTTITDKAVAKSILPYPVRVIRLTLACMVIKFFMAAYIDLGNDEAYYWLYTQQLRWNYFDHPPLVGVMGRIFTMNLALEDHEIFVRLGSIVMSAFATWFIFKTGTVLHSEKAGWFAAILYNTSFYSGIIAGLFIMPDSPQMFFWTLSLWMLAKLIRNDENSWTVWLFFGMAAGLSIMSKVHGVFIWTGFGLYLLFCKRSWFLKPQLYVSLFITIILISPILIWNIQHNFITYKYHSERVSVDGFGLNHLHFRNELYGQLFFNNPVNICLVLLTLYWGFKKRKELLPTMAPFLFIGIPLALILLFVALFRPIFPHWSGPAYISLLPTIGAWGAEMKKRKFFSGWLSWCFGAFLLFAFGWTLLINFYPGTWGSKGSIDYGREDFTLDRYGWTTGGKAFEKFYRNSIASKSLPANIPMVTHKWWGAHVEYYFARPAGIKMLGLGKVQEVGNYLWLNEERSKGLNLNQALCIIPSDEYIDPEVKLSPWYRSARLLFEIPVYRNGEKCRHFSVYLMEGWRGDLPVK